jgi:hypothetical protein
MEKTKIISSKVWNEARMPTLQSFNIVLEFLATERNKNGTNKKGRTKLFLYASIHKRS